VAGDIMYIVQPYPVRAVQPCNLKAVLAWVGMSSLVNKGLQGLSVWVMPSSFKTKVSGW